MADHADSTHTATAEGTSAEIFAASAKLPDIGSRIGPYKILQVIGEGGFGTVYMAEQTAPVHRRVALKVIKIGMDTKQVVARFEAERQALALMDHPHIARVLDAGATDTGRPFFVMELVKGAPITQYADRERLAIHQRLELFQQVCLAVQHAHMKGVIHRDIKPSNVLVSTQDGKPHARVIDFGIAKATDHRLTEKTLFTDFAQMIGTPEYMSPEQAEGSLDIDTRTDVYSLGVLLYELLCGTTPFEANALRSAGFAEMLRIIREVEPPSPSRNSARAHRGTAIGSDTPKLAMRDLDWVVGRAMSKDRNSRYRSASEFCDEIARWLAGEVVQAAPPSVFHRLRRVADRHLGLIRAMTLGMCVHMAFSAAMVMAAVAFVTPGRSGWVELPLMVACLGGPAFWALLFALITAVRSRQRLHRAAGCAAVVVSLLFLWWSAGVSAKTISRFRENDQLHSLWYAAILTDAERSEEAARVYAHAWVALVAELPSSSVRMQDAAVQMKRLASRSPEARSCFCEVRDSMTPPAGLSVPTDLGSLVGWAELNLVLGEPEQTVRWFLKAKDSLAHVPALSNRMVENAVARALIAEQHWDLLRSLVDAAAIQQNRAREEHLIWLELAASAGSGDAKLMAAVRSRLPKR